MKALNLESLWNLFSDGVLPVLNPYLLPQEQVHTARIMAPSSAAIDWDMLKPQVLRLLSEGKKRQEVVEEISKDGTNIT